MDDREKSRRILIVEDDRSLVQGLEFALLKEGFAVDSAHTAAEGETRALSEEYGLFLLDVNLPDGNGFDLCRKIRRSLSTPVVFLTACDEEFNIVQGLDLGGDDYISKPFRIRELVSRINAVLRRAHSRADREVLIRSGSIMIDRKSSRVLKEGRDLCLTATEYRLVGVLLANKGNIVTRDKLIEHLWDSEGHYVDSNTLSVYIRRLREKIEDDPGNPEYIETARGLGYRWR